MRAKVSGKVGTEPGKSSRRPARDDPERLRALSRFNPLTHVVEAEQTRSTAGC
ncbi:hypothetical protein SAMN02745673_01718 [Marinactinospora thermotolerans DSM 45154]|uniref:Uncharacterized protein n=1 Tax=Marinactinospora thermotolerans DSM 45154 TaxID=1122192 RepID=A0A1T4PC55_9ACTN|nr:hypothetical protein SAMN02745673_01718 [Marinactinospora thermotolerans DSM 45154]